MTMPNHTPGPWEMSGTSIKSRGRTIASAYFSPESGYIGGVKSRGVTEEEARSNACLIAAAPELLTALTQLLREIDYLIEDGMLNTEGVDDHPSIQAARAAIRKATGED